MDSLPLEILTIIANHLEELELRYGIDTDIGRWPYRTRRCVDATLSVRLVNSHFYAASLELFAGVLADVPFSLTQGSLATLDKIASHKGLAPKIHTLTFADSVFHWRSVANWLSAAFKSLGWPKCDDENEISAMIYRTALTYLGEEKIFRDECGPVRALINILPNFRLLKNLRLSSTAKPLIPGVSLPSRIPLRLATRVLLRFRHERLNHPDDPLLAALMRTRLKLQTFTADNRTLREAWTPFTIGLKNLKYHNLLYKLVVFYGSDTTSAAHPRHGHPGLLLTVLRGAPNLRELHWSGRWNNSIENLESRIQSPPSLRVLEISSARISAESLLYLIGDRLEILRVDWVKLFEEEEEQPLFREEGDSEFNKLSFFNTILSTTELERLEWTAYDYSLDLVLDSLCNAEHTIPLVKLGFYKGGCMRIAIFYNGERVDNYLWKTEYPPYFSGSYDWLFKLPLKCCKHEVAELVACDQNNRSQWAVPLRGDSGHLHETPDRIFTEEEEQREKEALRVLAEADEQW